MPAPKKKQKKKGNGKNKKKGKPKPKQKQKQKAKPNLKQKKNGSKSKQKNQAKRHENEEMKIESLEIRGINVVPLDKYKECGQTFPPSIPVRDLWEEKKYDVVQTMPHPNNGKYRMESSEKKAIENELIFERRLRDIREASEVHRQVRQAAQRFIKPGLQMSQICEFIERSSAQLVGYKAASPYERGWGFPTGVSLNNCAAHYTPNTGDKRRLCASDLCKIDFGVQINGNIIDCAFSMSFSERHDSLMEAVRAATNRGICVMGIDARLGEIGGEIQEVMESYECSYDNKVYGVKCIRNLNGHSIGPWEIHGGKTVPIVKTNDQTKMEENELFAIETFGTTGNGVVYDQGECSHFALIPNNNHKNHKINLHSINHRGAKDLYKFINKRFGTIPFCRRWLDDCGQKRHLMSLKNLVDYEIVRAYPPLCDIAGSFTAQYEHTILLKPTCKEIVSRGNDF